MKRDAGGRRHRRTRPDAFLPDQAASAGEHKAGQAHRSRRKRGPLITRIVRPANTPVPGYWRAWSKGTPTDQPPTLEDS